MTFIEFLNEDRRTNLSLEEAVKIFKEKCSHANLDRPFIRNARSYNLFSVVTAKGNVRTRQSVNNLSKVIVDKLMKDKYGKDAPLRSEATIFATNKAIHTFLFGGQEYYVFPFNDTDVAYIESEDFNYSGEVDSGVYNLLNTCRILHRSVESYADVIAHFKKEFGTVENMIEKMQSFFNKFANKYDVNKIKTFEDFVDQSHNLDLLKIHVVKGGDKIDQSKKYECWASGPCLVVHKSVFKEFKKIILS